MNAMPEQIGSPQFRVTKIQHKRTEAQRSIDTLQGLKTKGVEEASCRLFEELEATTIGEDVSSGVTEADCPGQASKVSAQVEDYTGTKAGSGDGWVRCDDCRKWRCISTELADMIDTTAARWTCLDNPNKDFANCSVPQEKSNAQINAELELSDDTDDEEDEDKETAADSKSIEFFQGSQPTTWKLIRRNIFLHRQRKTHDNDDYVICHCKQPADGSPGCGDDCMNRMVSMECVPEICPCGEACSNQQFRKRMYANVALFRSGKKGFGLKALENVPKGSFITEYVGEVLDMPTFEARQKDYAQNGQKHFYFMTLNSSEVIDAYAKGNWGRFINHSCEPNCQTEKWCVNGEICIGLFAIRDLVQGEEITFDYHYEPVYGAAAKKCECGSSQCRGYIGGQPPLNPTSIVESESDEEDPEPVMLEEESEEEVVNLELKSVASAKRFHGGSEAALWEPRIARAGRLKRKRSFGSKPDELENSLKGSSESKHPKYSTFMRKYTGPKELLLEPNVGRQGWGRPSRSIQPSEVEGKLSELLDAHGGLEKRKDVAKQYMKLLVLSIASGETVQGGPSWSVRDLSLLLDAVLKTSSKSVLSDILQNNGLQLLHNLVKQSRRNWKKLPILRKLMKVLELLSLKKVLTDRHISCIPSRDGMESFMESIVQLTHHDDTEVYQIARRFKTKWFSVGAMYSHRSFGEKHSKSQNWHSHFQQPMSQQRILYGDSSSPPLPNESSGLRNISLKSLEKPASQSVHSGSFVSAERCSSVSMLHTATGILATSALIVEGERDHFESRKSHDSTLPNNCNINMVNERPSRDKRNSCWDQPAITDNVCSEHQQILAGDSEAGLGGNVGILEDFHQSPFSFVSSTGIRFDSCRQSSQGWNYYDPQGWNYYDQSPDGHQASARNKVARIESFQSLSDSPTIKIDSRASIKSGHTNHLCTREHSKRPHRWFKGPNQPVRAKLSSQGSAMRSGALQTPSQGISSSAPRPGSYPTSVHVQPQAMQARAPQGHPLMGMVPVQPYHQPPLPIGPFPGPQMSVHLSAPRGEAFSTPPRWQPGLQLPVLPSVPAASLSGPTQIPNGVSHTSHFIPPRADSGNLQTTTVRGPGQVPLARAAFQSGLPATSPVFTQGELQSLLGSSARPHRAGYPFRSPEVFHCQGPPCVSENKLPMGRLGPSPTGASTYKRSDDGNRVPFVCRESMEGFEPEPPVPGL